MATMNLAEQLAKNAEERKRKLQELNKLDQEYAALRVKERKARTRHLIAKGGLVRKANLDKLPDWALFGALLSVRAKAVDKEQVATWEREGRAHFQAIDDAKVEATAKFDRRLETVETDELRDLGFRFVRETKIWAGRVNPELAQQLVDDLGGVLKIEAEETAPAPGRPTETPSRAKPEGPGLSA